MKYFVYYTYVNRNQRNDAMACITTDSEITDFETVTDIAENLRTMGNFDSAVVSNYIKLSD